MGYRRILSISIFSYGIFKLKSSNCVILKNFNKYPNYLDGNSSKLMCNLYNYTY